MGLPAQYAWLNGDLGGPLPTMVAAAIPDIGVLEKDGAGNNPQLMNWRTAARAAGYHVEAFTADSVPWCGLAMVHWAMKANKSAPKFPLYALNWASFGTEGHQPCLGDCLVFIRPGGGHVGLYIGEDRNDFYHVLAGNQSNAVNIKRIDKRRLYAVRRPPVKVAHSPAARPYILDATGAVSTNEA